MLALASSQVEGHRSRTFTLLQDLVPDRTSQGWGDYQANKAWYTSGFVIGGVTYDNAVLAHAPSRVVYDIERKYSTFSACAGLDDSVHEGGLKCGDGVDFSVFGDGGALLWKHHQKGGEAATCFDVNVRDQRKITLQASNVMDSSCDEAEWVNAKLTEDPVIDCYRLNELVPESNSTGWGSYWSKKAWYDNGFLHNGQRYDNGVFARANSKLDYPTYDKFDSFEACAGVDDRSTACGTGIDFEVFVDDTLAWKSASLLQPNQAPECFTIPINGSQQLHLMSTKETPSDTCDQSSWLNAKLCTEKETFGVHCKVSEWGDYGECTRSCGTGYQHGSRTILVSPLHGGDSCPELHRMQECNTNVCPVDCIVSDWTEYTECTNTCGDGGFKLRHRSVHRAAVFNGVACPVLAEKKTCGHQACPVDCVMSPWGDWSTCSLTCGNGEMTRERHYSSPAKFGGKVCPVGKQEKVCNNGPCSADCSFSAWGSFTTCSRSCGTGYQTRERHIYNHAQVGGTACPHTEDNRVCATQPCPIDCVTSDHHTWTVCDRSCGGGEKISHRSILMQNAYGGAECPALEQKEACNTGICPHSCEVAGFDAWTHCTMSCNGGAQMRKREVTRYANIGGAECPHLTEKRHCNSHACPVDCKIADYGMWQPCSATCGTGSEKAVRSIQVEPEFGGKPCAQVPMEKTRSCNTKPCPVDCEVTDWSDLTECSVSCEGGSKTHTRTIVNREAHGGVGCPGLQELIACNSQPCQVDCIVAGWGPWTQCTKTCAMGTQMRVRTINVPKKEGGKACPDTEERRICNSAGCPKPCVVTDFGHWSSCSISCGTGTKVRERTVDMPASNGGTPCPTLYETKMCQKYCPEDCQTTTWSGYGECSVGCGGGKQYRTRSMTRDFKYGGKMCPHLQEGQDCNIHKCPIHCIVTDYADWEACSRSCGNGIQFKRRTVSQDAAFSGQECPPLTDTRSCHTVPCPDDCVLSDWSGYNVCSKSCGMGFQTKTRTVVRDAAEGGQACGSRSHIQFCNHHECPVACTVTAWIENTACSVTCGGGVHGRRRSVIDVATHGGAKCPDLTENTACNEQACPKDCDMTYWTGWSDCSKTCGTDGTQTKTRAIVSQPAHGGEACEATTESQPCTVSVVCPVNCIVSLWSSYEACSVTCDGGTKWRSRTVVSHAESGGYACPSLTEDTPCGEYPCPVHCEVNPWSVWSECTRACGIGNKNRARTVKTAGAYGGQECPSLTAYKLCNIFSCATLDMMNANGGAATEASATAAPQDLWGWLDKPIEWQMINGKRMDVFTEANLGHIGRTAAPTAAPTKHPTAKALYSCQNGPESVAHGWHGAGYGGDYCNLCKCENGHLSCQNKDCGKVEAGSRCSHVTCKMEYNYAAGHKLLITHHHHAEHNGANHHCAHNLYADSCQCNCFGEANKHWVDYAAK